MPHNVNVPLPALDRGVPWPPYRWDVDGREAGGGPGTDDETVEMTKVSDGPPKLDGLALIRDALDLVVELWPQPGYASVTLETHQWVKLRRVLLAIPELVANNE
jgi:hypothetical protein